MRNLFYFFPPLEGDVTKPAKTIYEVFPLAFEKAVYGTLFFALPGAVITHLTVHVSPLNKIRIYMAPDHTIV